MGKNKETRSFISLLAIFYLFLLKLNKGRKILINKEDWIPVFTGMTEKNEKYKLRSNKITPYVS